MSESLKEMIAKLKAQNSQSSEIPKQIPQKEVEKEEDFDEDFDEEEEKPKKEEKPPVKAVKEVSEASETSKQQNILMDIARLQDNGVFRIELLHQLNEMNRALTVIAGVLVEISGNGKEK